MANFAAFHQLHDLPRMGQHGVAGKAGGDGVAAVHAGHGMVIRVAAALQRFFNDRRKILVRADVGDFRVGDHRGGEHPVAVALPHRHQAVGCKQNGRRDIMELGLLVLPSGAKVAL